MRERSLIVSVRSLVTKPKRFASIRVDWPKQSAAVAALAVDNDSGVFLEISENVRFDFVFFLFGIVAGHFSAVVAP